MTSNSLHERGYKSQVSKSFHTSLLNSRQIKGLLLKLQIELFPSLFKNEVLNQKIFHNLYLLNRSTQSLLVMFHLLSPKFICSKDSNIVQKPKFQNPLSLKSKLGLIHYFDGDESKTWRMKVLKVKKQVHRGKILKLGLMLTQVQEEHATTPDVVPSGYVFWKKHLFMLYDVHDISKKW